jgi:uncharacterized caspase-like protein
MHKELIIQLLGLQADASDEAIANAAKTFQADMVSFKKDTDDHVTALTNRAETAEQATKSAEQVAKKATEAADAIANEAKAMAEELVNVDLERYKDVIVNADEIKGQLMTNRTATVAILKNIKVQVKPERPAPIHNAKVVNQPAPVIPPQVSVTNEQAKRISNRAREIANTLKISHQQAWNMAQGETTTSEDKK